MRRHNGPKRYRTSRESGPHGRVFALPESEMARKNGRGDLLAGDVIH